jgi:hypothetical protein
LAGPNSKLFDCWHELQLDATPVLEHFSSHLDYAQAASVQASFLRERKGPLWTYDTQYFLCNSNKRWEEAQPSLRALGVENLVQRINAIEQIEHLLQSLKQAASEMLY